MEKKLVLNPNLDFFLAHIDEMDIPTKQDKFEPLLDSEVYQVDNEGNHVKLNEYELYLKKKGKDSLREFEQRFREKLLSKIALPPLFKDCHLEVIIGINMSQSRFNQVDLDNLLKSILDCMNNLVFKDDNQITSIIASKRINAIPKQNGLFIGVRVLSDNIKSYSESFQFGHFEDLSD